MIRLHGYWRSTAAYRVRIALAMKGVAHKQVPHDIRTGAHHDAAYRALNPQALIPAIEQDGTVLTQSQAIIEWLDETHPRPPLLPADATGRAIVRGMAAAIACEIHPLNNPRVLGVLRETFGAGEAQVSAWIARWIGAGFTALEEAVARHGGRFAFGDLPGLADIFLVPQLYSARRFDVDLSPYPHLVAAGAEAEALDTFASAHPSRQPDAD